MPEIQFQIQWPDGSKEVCYSPSLVVKNYFSAGQTYSLPEFLKRARESLNMASDRVQKKYGFPCGRALGQLAQLEAEAAKYATLDQAMIQVIQFIE